MQSRRQRVISGLLDDLSKFGEKLKTKLDFLYEIYMK